MIQTFSDIIVPVYMGKTEHDVYDWHAELRDKLAPTHSGYNITAAAYHQYSDAVDLLDHLLHWRHNLTDYSKDLTDQILAIFGQPGNVQVNPAPAVQLGPDPEEGPISCIGGIIQLVHNTWLPKNFRPSNLFTPDQQDYYGFTPTPKPPIDWNTAQPTVRALPTADGVLVRWRRNRAHGLRLEVNRGQGSWERINLPLTKWLDTTPPPAVPTEWTYRGTFIRSGLPVGQLSLPVSVTVKG